MQTYIHYLIELRSRLLRCLIVVISAFAVLCFFSKQLYDVLALPLLNHLPQGQTLIATSVTAPLFAPIKLAFFFAIFLAAPVIFYQLWAFIAPALYRQEKIWLWLLWISIFLFYLGIFFAYFVAFPVLFQFFIHAAPKSVEIKPDINQFLDFALKMFFAFGLAFDLPIIIIALVLSGITSVENLRKKRPYIIVAAFIIAMFLTPPDVISQISLAIPLWFLFEIGLFIAGWIMQRKTIPQKNSY